MSGSAYRLESGRLRPPPPPLRFESSSLKSNSSLSNNNTQKAPQALLYDLPSTSSIASPPSPRGFSPTSPSSTGWSRGGRKTRPTSPPSSRNRSITPSGVAPSELEVFAEHCRAWYFKQDGNAGRLMTQTLTNLPASQRAPFSRLQASIRSAYHSHNNAKRTAEFNAHLSSTVSGGSLAAHMRSDPNGPVARRERFDRFHRFVRSWCTVGMPGTVPFFEALWAVMRLQVIPREIGGAGGNRIEWEMDDAVFMEAGGKKFMLDAIDTMKGVLGFEETASKRVSVTGHPQPFSTISHPHFRTQSQPLPSEHPRPRAAPSIMGPMRARAPSDPFLDTPALSHSIPTSSSQSSGNTIALLSSTLEGDEPPSPISLAPDGDNYIGSSARSSRNKSFEDDTEDEAALRIWTSPNLSNPELHTLLSVFPAFVTRRTLPRFPVPAGRQRDVEEIEEERGEGKEIQFGTGTMWVSSKLRTDGWSGSWWSRFVLWWRQTFFCC